jgi:hypothetical protein
MTTNSSPPQRAAVGPVSRRTGISALRADFLMRSPISRRTRSPVGWPNESLIRLKWSISSLDIDRR